MNFDVVYVRIGQSTRTARHSGAGYWELIMNGNQTLMLCPASTPETSTKPGATVCETRGHVRP